ncbi:hypothetical protein PPL_07674 [Heterostelium album PN500]|uniref:TFA2 Winged helix domain-containing protein n=1 Tax=Heterostelium pallidum (strain ATCC 26659 / Pp 5 / PN500) TaxID=670386 RepID=D3BGM2_HETP5|nr:hypothetical protein PPL_07674 [Heterostelium album PN500]EFA79256.1 hypothetical protein PPL_07674 [Heterostelium album PN500]|eukprot:XP_020431377.1 hypothetical protein PPL_07674 [Heterostelium album PN500]
MSLEFVNFEIIKHLKLLEGQYITFEDLYNSTGHNLYNNHLLLQSLKQNTFIEFLNDKTLRYIPQYQVKNQNDILELLSRQPEGILLEDLKASYANAENDVNKLKQSKSIYSVISSNSKSEKIYYNDEKYRVPCSDELVRLWGSVEVPIEVDLENVMREAGLTPVEKYETTKTIKVKNVEKQEKKRRIKKVTNTHIESFDPNQ